MPEISTSRRCRGMRDLLPDEMARFRRVEQVFRRLCEVHGFSEIRTPTIEYLHLFTRAGTLSPRMLSRVYSFLDWDGWSGERVVLRPDATIPAVRLYTERFTPGEVAKLYYVENVFRFSDGDESREDWQCGLEVIGDTAPVGDIELILVALRVVEQLGLTAIEVRLSHAGLMRAVLAKAGLSPEEQTQLYDRLLDGDLGVVNELEGRLPLLDRPLRLLLELQGNTPAFLTNLSELFSGAIPEISQPLAELMPVAETLHRLGYSLRLSAALVRDFEYYTGPVFQIWAGDCQVGAGGRYDDLIRLVSGQEVPASGLALKLDVLSSRLAGGEQFDAVKTVIIQPSTAVPLSLTAAFEAAQRLTDTGWRALLQPSVTRGAMARWELTIDVRESELVYLLHDRESGSWTVHRVLEGALAVMAGDRS